MSRTTRLAVASGAAGALGALAVAAARTGRGVSEEMGATPSGARLTRMQGSPQWAGERFRNADASVAGGPEGDAVTQRDAIRRLITGRALRQPPVTIPTSRTGAILPTEGVWMSWLGHASALVSLGGSLILLDPVWSDRCSPSQFVGPQRLHPTPFALGDLPTISAVVISHDHYDHLDMATIKELVALQDCPFVVPLGIGAHLERWGVPARRIVELDWTESYAVDEVTLTAVAAQHFSGRGLRRDGTLWASWVLESSAGKVYFSGDTGYFSGFSEIGSAHGPFDVALMAVGMYDPAWRSIRLDPEEAVTAAQELGARLAVPIHWCTFVLAPHPWSEPVERFLEAASGASVEVAVPTVGQPVDVSAPPQLTPWWRAPGR